MRFSQSAIGAVLGGAVAVSALNKIIIKERHFYDSVTNKPFFVRGVDYQPGGSSGYTGKSDPLTDIQGLARDIYMFQKLGINTIRVYSVNPALDHNEAMTMLNAAGIYVVLDVNTPLEQEHLHDQEPWTTYTEKYLNHIFMAVEVFGGYDNLMGVIAGNEVVFKDGSEVHSPRYVKAVVRDLKKYMKKNMPDRQIPVGYANGDVLKFRVSLADYLQCGTNDENLDFFGVNSYQWCGPDATFETSGYNTLVEDFKNYSIPLFFTEYGCNKPAPRAFNEVPALYSTQMTGVFSGGLVYQYNQDTNDFGLVTVDDKSNSGSMNKDFDTLAKKFNGLDTPTIPAGAVGVARPTTCDGPFPDINGTSTLPVTLGAKLIENGIDGEGTKWKKGKFIDVSKITTKSKYAIIDSNGKTVQNAAFNDDVTEALGAGSGTEGAAPAETTKPSAASTVASVGFSSLLSAAVVAVAAALYL